VQPWRLPIPHFFGGRDSLERAPDSGPIPGTSGLFGSICDAAPSIFLPLTYSHSVLIPVSAIQILYADPWSMDLHVQIGASFEAARIVRLRSR
jgi:hypothetical protein